MLTSIYRRTVHVAAAIVAAALFSSCVDRLPPEVTAPGDAALAKGGGKGGGSTDLTVTAADPSYAEQGATYAEITITGSGFDGDVQVAWERGGVADPRITVHSAAVINSKRITARISVAEEADAGLYDISVTRLGPGGKKGVGTELFEVTQKSPPTDPTASWLLPLDDEGLAVRSDGQFSDGTYSVYANGVCGVDATIFATTQRSNSGDGTIQTNAPSTGKGKKGNACSRSFRLHYPDGFTEAVPSFNNLRKLQNTETVIPIGATVKRQLILNPSVMGESRCGRLLWGEGDFGGGVGSDSVLVTRLNARTWHVQSQPSPNNKAWCRDMDGELLAMPPVSFRIVAGRDLP